mmetsp:Transcript_105598/g.327888  ORF Transcript_105598/g.327888 Transcript_105598/m.327888 type:complete len:254 (-) Transcript_105598:286-1047(-)
MPTGSTSTSFRALATSACWRIVMNSVREMRSSWSSSSCERTLCSFSVTLPTCSASFSASATALTTSQRMPMSMFIRVSADREMNMRKSTKQTALSSRMAVHMSSRLSRKTPWISKVYMEVETESKKRLPRSDPAASCVKAIAKTYMKAVMRNRTVMTDRMADNMPLTRISSSGMTRIIRTMRVSLRSLKSLRMETLLKLSEPSTPAMTITMVKIHVSPTIMNTKQESKTNQASRRQSLVRRKDMKRTSHSKEK